MAKSSNTKVTRITASDSTSTKPKKAPKAKKPATKKTSAKPAQKAIVAAEAPTARRSKNPFTALIGYFKGAWYELKQVRWPDRANTWRMTGALLVFTAFFLFVIVTLDALFKYIFQLILGA